MMSEIAFVVGDADAGLAERLDQEISAFNVISDPDAQAAIWFLGALSGVRVSGAQTRGITILASPPQP
jgi:hypothetical protein